MHLKPKLYKCGASPRASNTVTTIVNSDLFPFSPRRMHGGAGNGEPQDPRLHAECFIVPRRTSCPIERSAGVPGGVACCRRQHPAVPPGGLPAANHREWGHDPGQTRRSQLRDLLQAVLLQRWRQLECVQGG